MSNLYLEPYLTYHDTAKVAELVQLCQRKPQFKPKPATQKACLYAGRNSGPYTHKDFEYQNLIHGVCCWQALQALFMLLITTTAASLLGLFIHYRTAMKQKNYFKTRCSCSWRTTSELHGNSSNK